MARQTYEFADAGNTWGELPSSWEKIKATREYRLTAWVIRYVLQSAYALGQACSALVWVGVGILALQNLAAGIKLLPSIVETLIILVVIGTFAYSWLQYQKAHS